MRWCRTPATLGITFSHTEEDKRERILSLKKNIFSFPTLSSPGPSSLRSDHLKDMLQDLPGDSSAQLLVALDWLATHAISEGLPQG